MGCGASSIMPAVPENLLPANTGESSRRRRNAAGKHSHLQNTIDESVDALAVFRQYAISSKAPAQDWKAFVHDDHDNFGESALREAATQMAQAEELRSHANLEFIKQQNAHIATLREIMQELKIYDEFVLAYDESVNREREARRLVMVAQDKLEKAKAKPTFETQRPGLEAAIKDRDAAHIAATKAVETARQNREDQSRKLRAAKSHLALKSLNQSHASSVQHHEASLAALAKQRSILEKLEQAHAAEQLAAAAAAAATTATATTASSASLLPPKETTSSSAPAAISTPTAAPAPDTPAAPAGPPAPAGSTGSRPATPRTAAQPAAPSPAPTPLPATPTPKLGPRASVAARSSVASVAAAPAAAAAAHPADSPAAAEASSPGDDATGGIDTSAGRRESKA